MVANNQRITHQLSRCTIRMCKHLHLRTTRQKTLLAPAQAVTDMQVAQRQSRMSCHEIRETVVGLPLLNYAG
jgi:hypothetical protein